MLFTKKFFIIACALGLGLHTQAQLKLPQASSFQAIKQSLGLSEISIEYSRPNVNQRDIFGALVPYNKVWRTGANASTKITFGDDVTINGKPLPAGTYGLFTIPGQRDWEVLFSTDTKLGANVAAYDTQKEVLRVKVPAMRSPFFVESFTIQFMDVKPTSAALMLAWANTAVQLDIKTEIDSRVMASIDEALKGDKPPYFQAASYYYENNKDINKANEWVQKAAAEMPDAYWVQALKARIELKMNNKRAAAASAQKVIDLAGKAGNQDYVAIGQNLLAQAK